MRTGVAGQPTRVSLSEKPGSARSVCRATGTFTALLEPSPTVSVPTWVPALAVCGTSPAVNDELHRQTGPADRRDVLGDDDGRVAAEPVVHVPDDVALLQDLRRGAARPRAASIAALLTALAVSRIGALVLAEDRADESAVFPSTSLRAAKSRLPPAVVVEPVLMPMRAVARDERLVVVAPLLAGRVGPAGRLVMAISAGISTNARPSFTWSSAVETVRLLQARGVGVRGVRHAEFLGGGVHLLDERLLGAPASQRASSRAMLLADGIMTARRACFSVSLSPALTVLSVDSPVVSVVAALLLRRRVDRDLRALPPRPSAGGP